MTTEHDEQLVGRVAFAIFCNDPDFNNDAAYMRPQWANLTETGRNRYRAKAIAAIYPPAPPKTRLQVARELLAAAYESCGHSQRAAQVREMQEAAYVPELQAVLAALALPAMENDA